MPLPLLRPPSPQYERILASFHGVGGGLPQLHCRRGLAPALPDVDHAIASKESELRATMGELQRHMVNGGGGKRSIYAAPFGDAFDTFDL